MPDEECRLTSRYSDATRVTVIPCALQFRVRSRDWATYSLAPQIVPKTTILHVELARPSPAKTDAIGDKSWFLRAATTFRDLIVLAFGAPGMRKDASLGRLCADLQPLDDNRYEIELAAILAERLPCPKDSPEYVVSIADTAAVDRRFCVSNLMQIIRYRKKDEYRHALCPAAATERFIAENAGEFECAPHIEYLPSVVTALYLIAGEDVDDALSGHLETTVDDFIGGINRLVAAHVVTIDTEKTGILSPVYDRGSFPWVYLLVRGANDRFRAERVATSLLRTTLIAHPYEETGWKELTARASGDEAIDIAIKALRTAESQIQAGVYEFALLLLAIAVEVATARFVFRRLCAEGVSKRKLKDIEADLTFSIMLNTQVVALAPAKNKPEPRLIKEIDRIRRLRNDLMHKGRFELTRPEIYGLVKSAQAYLSYLESLEKPAE